LKGVTKNPDELLQLPLIPHWRLKFLPEKLLAPTSGQRKSIKQILNMRRDQPFMRCKGSNWKFIRAREAAGDFSHSDRKHSCDECRCTRLAGSGTRGNFYGLGPETGHLGVFLCWRCQLATRLRPGLVVKHARNQARLLQLYGTVSMDSDYAQKEAAAGAALALQSRKARAEVQLVVDTLEDFKKQLASTDESKQPCEYQRGVPMKMSDKTRIQLLLRIAATLSRLNLNEITLSEDKYLHVDELKVRMPQMINLVQQCLAKLEELIVTKQVKGEEVETDQTPQEYVRKIFQDGMTEIWATVKQGRRN